MQVYSVIVTLSNFVTYMTDFYTRTSCLFLSKKVFHCRVTVNPNPEHLLYFAVLHNTDKIHTCEKRPGLANADLYRSYHIFIINLSVMPVFEPFFYVLIPAPQFNGCSPFIPLKFVKLSVLFKVQSRCLICYQIL